MQAKLSCIQIGYWLPQNVQSLTAAYVFALFSVESSFSRIEALFFRSEHGPRWGWRHVVRCRKTFLSLAQAPFCNKLVKLRVIDPSKPFAFNLELNKNEKVKNRTKHDKRWYFKHVTFLCETRMQFECSCSDAMS